MSVANFEEANVPSSNTTPPSHTSTKERQIERLLYVSLVLATLTLIASMVNLGLSSLFVSIAGFVLTLAFDITLLVLTVKARRRSSTRGNGTDLTPSAWMSNLGGPSCTLRRRSIVCSLLLIIIWLGAVGLVITTVAIVDTWDQWYEGGRLVVSGVCEAIFTFGQIGVLVAYAVLAIKERKRRIGGQATLKWYQLGEYKVGESSR